MYFTDLPFAFPTFADFVPAAKVLAGRLRGDTSADLGCCLQAAWTCAGYALSHVPHDHPQTFAATSAPDDAPDDAHAAALLDGAAALRADATAGVPWGAILALALDLLKRWLNS